jgi:hypothetical protein
MSSNHASIFYCRQASLLFSQIFSHVASRHASGMYASQTSRLRSMIAIQISCLNDCMLEGIDERRQASQRPYLLHIYKVILQAVNTSRKPWTTMATRPAAIRKTKQATRADELFASMKASLQDCKPTRRLQANTTYSKAIRLTNKRVAKVSVF